MRGLLEDCSPATIAAEQLPADKLAALNLIMTKRRIAARSAPLTRFHDLIGRLYDEDRLVRCLTESFDGTEERCRAGFSDRLTMLYGDNRQLCCCTPRCRTTSQEEAYTLDKPFLEGKRVLCMDCCRISECLSLNYSGAPLIDLLTSGLLLTLTKLYTWARHQDQKR